MYGRQVTLADCGKNGIARASEAEFDVMIVDHVPRGVDTPPDLDRARAALKS